MGIESTSPGYGEKLREWATVEAVCDGKGITAERIDELSCFMPSPVYTVKYWKDANDNSKDNLDTIDKRKAAYWSRPVLLPATPRTADAYEGMIWGEEPECELPTVLEDAFGSIRNVSQEVTKALVTKGRCCVLTDMPDSVGSISDGNLPYPVFYTAEQLFFWRTNDKGQLVEARLAETFEEMTGEFDWEVKPQIRRLIINESGNYESSIYRDGKIHGEPIEPMIDKKPLKHIPLRVAGADNNSFNLGPTPLYLMSRMNLAHFRLDADDRDMLHFCAQPITVVALGESESTDTFMESNGGVVDTGAGGINILMNGGSISYTQMEAVSAISVKMDSDMKNMIAAGAQMVKDTTDSATLGSRKMEFSSSTSTLKKIGRNQTQMMTDVVSDMCAFMGIEPVDYNMKPVFVTDEVDAQILQQALQYVATLGFPIDIAIEAAKKAGLHDMSVEDMKDKIEAEPMPLKTMTEEDAIIAASNQSD